MLRRINVLDVFPLDRDIINSISTARFECSYCAPWQSPSQLLELPTEIAAKNKYILSVSTLMFDCSKTTAIHMKAIQPDANNSVARQITVLKKKEARSMMNICSC